MVDTRMDELVWLPTPARGTGNDLLREMVRSFAQGLMSAGGGCDLRSSTNLSPDTMP